MFEGSKDQKGVRLNRSTQKRNRYIRGEEPRMTGTSAVVKSGSDLVRQETGEVVGAIDFNMPDYLTSISTPAAIQHQKKLSAAYDAVCASLIGENDVQKDGGRTFKKKSAWRKLQRHFNISTSVVGVETKMMGEHLVATVNVRASAPWGQSAEAVGACGGDEATGRRTITIADAIATAETRATNRAVSNLIAMGEVSAEEIDKRPPKPPEEKIMPFGSDKGKKLGDIDSAALDKIIMWCIEKGKYADLVESCRAVIEARAEKAADGPDDNDEEPY